MNTPSDQGYAGLIAELRHAMARAIGAEGHAAVHADLLFQAAEALSQALQRIEGQDAEIAAVRSLVSPSLERMTIYMSESAAKSARIEALEGVVKDIRDWDMLLDSVPPQIVAKITALLSLNEPDAGQEGSFAIPAEVGATDLGQPTASEATADAASPKARFVSACCEGEVCSCGQPAVAKVEETIFLDDPNPNRHPLTAYVCADHFGQFMGRLAQPHPSARTADASHIWRETSDAPRPPEPTSCAALSSEVLPRGCAGEAELSRSAQGEPLSIHTDEVKP